MFKIVLLLAVFNVKIILMKKKPKINEKFKFPQNCSQYQECILTLNIQEKHDGYLQFKIHLQKRKISNAMKIGFFVEDKDIVDVIQITSTGKIKDSHMSQK